MPDKSSSLYTLEVAITKSEQTAPSKVEHTIIIRSHNLTLDETITMQSELAPALMGWLKADAA